MPRTTATARTSASRRYTPRDQANDLYLNGGPGAFCRLSNFEPSGGGGTTLSVFAWVLMGYPPPTGRAVVSKFDFANNRRSWAITSPNSQMQFLLSANGLGVQKRYQTYTYFNDGLWHPIGFTWGAGGLKVCADLDYDIVVNKLSDLVVPNLYQGTADVMHGCLLANNNPVNQWEGKLGPLVISNQELTEADWLNFVYDGLSPAGLELELLLQEGSGATANDTSGNGRHSTLNANVYWEAQGAFGEKVAASPRTLIT